MSEPSVTYIDRSGEMMESNPQQSRRSMWPFLAGSAALFGSLVWLALTWFIGGKDDDQEAEIIKDCFASLVVLGLVGGGVGQFMRAAAHGTRSPVGRRIDGWGKVLGVFAWALGLAAGLFFSIENTNVPVAIVVIAVASSIVLFAFALLYYVRLPFWRRSPGN